MLENQYVHIKRLEGSTNHHVEEGEPISVYSLARSMTIDNFTCLIDEFLNLGGKGYREGKEVGLQLRLTHRTLQRLAICFTLGLIAGLSEQEYSDPRNETAIQTAKKVVQLVASGELPLRVVVTMSCG